MRVTVCELPHEPQALAAAWAALCDHTIRHSSELVLLPEFAMVEPVWEEREFDAARWTAVQALSEAWLQRLPELRAAYVVGARPVTIGGRPFNQGFLWSTSGGLVPLRRKYYLPNEPGNWEAHWFDRGDPAFGEYHAGTLSFGLNICTELWAVETYASYAARGVPVILSPRATAAATTAKWLSAGVVAAVRSGAFSLSSNRVDPTGNCGGVGWIIDPYGRILAQTSPATPFATMDIDLSLSAAAQGEFPATCSAENSNPRGWESGSGSGWGGEDSRWGNTVETPLLLCRRRLHGTRKVLSCNAGLQLAVNQGSSRRAGSVPRSPRAHGKRRRHGHRPLPDSQGRLVRQAPAVGASPGRKRAGQG